MFCYQNIFILSLLLRLLHLKSTRAFFIFNKSPFPHPINISSSFLFLSFRKRKNEETFDLAFFAANDSIDCIALCALWQAPPKFSHWNQLLCQVQRLQGPFAHRPTLGSKHQQRQLLEPVLHPSVHWPARLWLPSHCLRSNVNQTRRALPLWSALLSILRSVSWAHINDTDKKTTFFLIRGLSIFSFMIRSPYFWALPKGKPLLNIVESIQGKPKSN